MALWLYDSYPIDNGANDAMDSARLAAMMNLARCPRKVNLLQYLDVDTYLPRRWPKADTNDFSRDQLLPFIAALYDAGHIQYCRIIHDHYESKGWIVNGKDPLNPAHRNHLRICAGYNASWWGLLWLKAEILWGTKIKPYDESNQLLAMLFVAPREYMKSYVRKHRDFTQPINQYWKDSYRNEPELAYNLINRIAKEYIFT